MINYEQITQHAKVSMSHVHVYIDVFLRQVVAPLGLSIKDNVREEQGK